MLVFRVLDMEHSKKIRIMILKKYTRLAGSSDKRQKHRIVPKTTVDAGLYNK